MYVEYQNGLIQTRSGGGADSKAAADELNDERKRILEEREKWEQEKTQVRATAVMYVCTSDCIWPLFSRYFLRLVAYMYVCMYVCVWMYIATFSCYVEASWMYVCMYVINVCCNILYICVYVCVYV